MHVARGPAFLTQGPRAMWKGSSRAVAGASWRG